MSDVALPSVIPSPPAATADLDLAAYGLGEADLPKISTLAGSIRSDDPGSALRFGREAARTDMGDELLALVRNKDLNQSGQALSEVVQIASRLNAGMVAGRSRLPLIGGLIDRMRDRVGVLSSQFESTRSQIDRLMVEVDTTQQALEQRNQTLEQTFQSVEQDVRALGQHVVAAKLRVRELLAEADQHATRSDGDLLAPQRVSDLRSLATVLDKRAGDLLATQQSALQNLPQIRLIQHNNRQLIEKFHTVRDVVLPSWKRNFVIALSLNEQRNAAELVRSIDDAANDMLRRNAELLHSNSVETAKANNRMVIDVATLQAVQQQLVQTVTEVQQLQAQGARDRITAEQQILQMRRAQQQLAQPSGQAG